MLRYAELAGAAGQLDAACRWAELATRDLTDLEGFVGPSSVFPDDRFPLKPSLYYGEAGVWATAALARGAVGDGDGTRRAVDRFVAIAAACPTDALDAAHGAAGLLLGTAALMEELGEAHAPRLRTRGDELSARLTALAAGRVGGERGKALAWLGAAHGWCGLAHGLLRWCQATGADPSDDLLALLDWLAERRLPSGLYPCRIGSDEVWAGWCHGSAGWVQLWSLAREVLDDEDFLGLAEAPAADAAGRDDGGPGMCCGQIGQAYALLALHRATGEEIWLSHAQRLAAVAANAPLGEWFPQDSLWRGDLGLALLALELTDPERAAMPMCRARARP